MTNPNLPAKYLRLVDESVNRKRFHGHFIPLAGQHSTPTPFPFASVRAPSFGESLERNRKERDERDIDQ